MLKEAYMRQSAFELTLPDRYLLGGCHCALLTADCYTPL